MIPASLEDGAQGIAGLLDLIRMFNTKGHRTLSTLHREALADLDQVIGDHAESDPAFHVVAATEDSTAWNAGSDSA